ncbi:MAG: SRPBCC family protein [Bacteroidaceae bacterium]|nr:SRPBCC family protein [Bacteroidaceae bacterium]MBR5707492.1 SRPBCC family protein [Bacteroidaceae bacterium]
MKRIESGIKQIPYSQESVYGKVSDLSNLKYLAERIPEDQKNQFKAEDLECTPDRVSCTISPIGQIEVGVVAREPLKCVKMETLRSPIKLTLWIQIVSTGDSSCKIKITVDADLNVFMAKMVEKPLTEAVEKLADMLSMLPY